MSDTLKIGHVIDQPQERDAIHIAVAPMLASQRLSPGQPVGLAEGTADHATSAGKPIGIVDPFLTAPVRAGDRFWLFLFPGSITSLRHGWTHPAFPDVEAAYKSTGDEAWLREFADRAGLSLVELIRAANDWVSSGGNEYHCFDYDTPIYVTSEFWPHYEAYTKRTVAEDLRENFFTCSC